MYAENDYSWLLDEDGAHSSLEMLKREIHDNMGIRDRWICACIEKLQEDFPDLKEADIKSALTNISAQVADLNMTLEEALESFRGEMRVCGLLNDAEEGGE